MTKQDPLKVVFELECVDGYPPVQYEMLNAEALPDDKFRLKNVPFFTAGVSYGDVVVAVETDDPAKFDFLAVEERSSYTSISILLLEDSIGEELKKFFSGHDCVMEYGEFGVVHIFAVAIPIQAPYAQLRKQLEKLEEKEKISFAELAVAHR